MKKTYMVIAADEFVLNDDCASIEEAEEYIKNNVTPGMYRHATVVIVEVVKVFEVTKALIFEEVTCNGDTNEV